MSESEASWTENLFCEAPSQVMSLGDEYTPIQEEADYMKGEGEHFRDVGSSLGEEVSPHDLEKGDTNRVKRKRTNVDYRKKNTMKRNTLVSIAYKEAIITGNPQSELARIAVGYEVGLGMSVYAKGGAVHKGDYITHYAVKRTLTAEEYADICNNKKYTPTPLQHRDKDYTYKNSNNEYWIGDYGDRQCGRGVAQFMNCATPGTEERNTCKLVPFTKDTKK